MREEPSRVVVDFLDFIVSQKISPRTALDIGCGGGRNSIYLAEKHGLNVTAIDFTAAKIDALHDIARARRLNITVLHHDLGEPWPLSDASFDLAIDCYCFKHLISEQAITNYISELERVLRPDGLALLFLAAKDDGYYRDFASHEQDGPGMLIVDPGNGIASRLYNAGEIEGLFSGFNIQTTAKPGQSAMHGRTYRRSSFVFKMAKKPAKPLK